MLLDRRRFIALGVMSIIASTGILTAQSSVDRMIVRTLHENLPGYRFDSEGLALFVAIQRKELQTPARRAAAFVSVNLSEGVLPEQARQKLERIKRNIVSQFLLGSDFFMLGGDRSRVIRFAGVPIACGNPFARFG